MSVVRLVIVLITLLVESCSIGGGSASISVLVLDEFGQPIEGALAEPAPPLFQQISNSKGRLSFSSAGAITANGYEPFVISDELLLNKNLLLPHEAN